ncbi:hypothetical protein BT69DRAFT_1280615, partial [Atractiella rhizophila]
MLKLCISLPNLSSLDLYDLYPWMVEVEDSKLAYLGKLRQLKEVRIFAFEDEDGLGMAGAAFVEMILRHCPYVERLWTLGESWMKRGWHSTAEEEEQRHEKRSWVRPQKHLDYHSEHRTLPQNDVAFPSSLSELYMSTDDIWDSFAALNIFANSCEKTYPIPALRVLEVGAGFECFEDEFPINYLPQILSSLSSSLEILRLCAHGFTISAEIYKALPLCSRLKALELKDTGIKDWKPPESTGFFIATLEELTINTHGSFLCGPYDSDSGYSVELWVETLERMGAGNLALKKFALNNSTYQHALFTTRMSGKKQKRRNQRLDIILNKIGAELHLFSPSEEDFGLVGLSNC